MRQLKQTREVTKRELTKQAIDRYAKDCLELTDESVEKCMEDIMTKDYAKLEGETYIYLP